MDELAAALTIDGLRTRDVYPVPRSFRRRAKRRFCTPGRPPGQSPGIYQINAQVPQAAATGKAQVQIGYTENGRFFRSSLQDLWIVVK